MKILVWLEPECRTVKLEDPIWSQKTVKKKASKIFQPYPKREYCAKFGEYRSENHENEN